MKTFITLFASAALTLSATAHADAPPTTLTEGFDDVGALSGWVLNGTAVTESWFQGNGQSFAAYAGAATSYIATNYDTADLDTGVIDNWLITPEFTLTGASQLTFYTRTDTAEGYNDSLEVLFSSGSGTGAGGFTTSLIAIGGAVAYPGGWTQYTADISGLGTGRIGFHYTGTYDTANYIGIDSVAIAAVPEPSTWLMLGLGLAGVGIMARRSRRSVVSTAASTGLALAALGMSTGAMATEPGKAQGLVVVKDAETGQLRAPTAAEYRALVPQSAARTDVKSGRGIATPANITVAKDGTRSADVQDKAMYSVLVRNADGTTSAAHAVGEQAANAIVNNAPTAQAQERRHEEK